MKATGFENPEKNSLDSRARWGIFASIKISSKAWFSPSLDLGTFKIANGRHPLPSGKDSR
jgi:hypothetical protein